MQFINAEKICKGMELGEVPPNGKIIRDAVNVAWPSVLESFFVCLAGMVDTIMVGSLGSFAIAAVGLTTQPKFLGLAVFLSMNVAVSALVARRKGAGDRESANRIVRMALLITIGLTVIISSAFVAFAGPIIKMVGSQPDTHEYAVEYLQIIMGGLGFSTISLMLNAAQRGAGNTRIAMLTNVISNTVNVIFNYLLIGGNFGFPAMGVRGAALATVIGTVCACALSIASVLRKDGFINLRSVKGWIADRMSVHSLLNVGSSAFVEQICLRIGFLLFSMTVAHLGTTQMAAHQIGMNLMSMSFSFGDGLSVASVTLIGQSLGRQRPDGKNLRKCMSEDWAYVRLPCVRRILPLWQADICPVLPGAGHSGLWHPDNAHTQRYSLLPDRAGGAVRLSARGRGYKVHRIGVTDKRHLHPPRHELAALLPAGYRAYRRVAGHLLRPGAEVCSHLPAVPQGPVDQDTSVKYTERQLILCQAGTHSNT